VLGNRGRGPFTAALVGSVALRCAHQARCPVVLVPNPDPPAFG
jgi:nucleotide-binding universal stress UspA family protein